jgi:DNA-binding MarR family transcriptional regulator
MTLPPDHAPPTPLASVVDHVETLVNSMLDRMVRAPEEGKDAPRGLTYPQYRVLAHLCACGPMPVGEVGHLVGMARSSATEMAGRLERDGLVTKSRPRPRSREVLLAPTPRAHELVSARRGHHRAAFERMLERLSPAERQEMVHALETLGRLLGRALP